MKQIFKASEFCKSYQQKKYYEVEEDSFEWFSEDLKELFGQIKAKFTQKRYGSERSLALITELRGIIPSTYR